MGEDINQRKMGPSNNSIVVVNVHKCYNLVESGTATEDCVPNHVLCESTPMRNGINVVNSLGNTMNYKRNPTRLADTWAGLSRSSSIVVPGKESRRNVPLFMGTTVIRAQQRKS